MRKFTIFLMAAAFMLSSSVIWAQQITTGGNDVKTNFSYERGSRDVLYDQLGTPTTGAYASQNFEPSYDIYDSYVADDFVVPTGEQWVITSVTATGGEWGTPGGFTQANVYFYADNGGQPANAPFESLMAITVTGSMNGTFDIPLPSNVILAGGNTYWISVQAEGDYATYGQWGFADNDLPVVGNESYFLNPGGGFGSLYTTWTSFTIFQGVAMDMSFALEGSSEPASIAGYVLNGGGQTIAGVTIEVVENGRTTTTNATGYYEFYGLPDGTYNLTATKTGYNPATGGPVTTVTGTTQMLDFTMTAPNITVSPLIFDETLHPNEYLTKYLGLLNTGDGPVDWAAGITFISPAPMMADNPMTVDIPGVITEKGPAQQGASNGLAPASGVQGTPETSGSGLRGAIAFGFEAINGVLMDFDVDNFGGHTSFAASPAPPDFISGMAFPRGETDFAYAVVYGSTHLYSVERATGALTDMGALAGPAPGFNDITVDPTTGIVYAAGSDDALYIIDPSGMTTTYLGAFVNASIMIGIACDGNGDLWGYDIGYDWFYSIDKNTGLATDVGSIGFDANYAQCAFYDPDTDNILLGAFNNGNFYGEIRVADRATGNTTVLSSSYFEEPTGAALPVGGGGPSGGWLTLDTYSGSVAPGGGSFNIGVNFDAAGTTAGEVYTAEIVISTNPFVGEVTIPVTMTIGGDPFPTIADFAGEVTNQVTGEVTLTWSAPARATLDYYMIYRDGAPLTSVDAAATSYIDMLPAFGSYEYELQPIFLEGSGSPVGPVEVEWFEPALCWYPAAPENTQWVEQLQPVDLGIENCGNGVLEFTFPDYAARALLSDPNIEKNKTTPPFDVPSRGDENKGQDEAYNGQGNPVILGAGGPDAFGYVWIDSDEAGGPVYNWIEISGTGTEITGLGDDNTVGPFPFSFNFPFYGSDKTEFYIQSNGTITFEGSYLGYSNNAIPGNTGYTPQEFIAWFWDDMDPGGANTHVYYQDFGNYMVIQFEHYNEYPDGNNYYIDAEVILYQSGAILVQYDYIHPSMDDDGMTIGIQADPSLGLQVAYNTAYVHDDLALSFTLPSHFIVDVDPFYGTVGEGLTADVVMTYSSEGFEEGVYTEDLFITTNEQPVNEWNIPNTMYVVQPETISGLVTDCNTGQPMGNVTVTAVYDFKDNEPPFVTETAEDGTYMLYVNPGYDYDVSAEKTGYQTGWEYVSSGDLPAVVDFELCEEPYAVDWVFADPNEADDECMVTWSLP
ncbi:MAG: hypothetical protein DRJ02_11560, partial [Bacteroidetes bacterium]